MKYRQEESTLVSKWVRPLLFGLVAGLLGCAGLLVLCAAIMAMQDIPQMAVTPLAVVAAAVGSVIGGFTCARITRSRGLLGGAACGVLLYFLIMIMGFSVLQDIRGWYALIKLLVMVIGGAVGGVLGVNKRRR